MRERRVVPHARELGVRAELGRFDPEHVVADRELPDGCADRVHRAGQFAPEDPPLRPADPAEGADEERVRLPEGAISPVDRRRADADEHLVVLGNRAPDLLDPQDLRRPVAVVDDGSQRRTI